MAWRIKLAGLIGIFLAVFFSYLMLAENVDLGIIPA